MINILHLEDNSADAEIILTNLEEAGFNCQVTRIQTCAELETALGDDDLDLILAEYGLPMCDGMTALGLAQERRPEVPFIFVSSSMSKDAALTVLTHGAANYVSKPDLRRLKPAVNGALKAAQKRHAHFRFFEKLDRINRIIQGTNDLEQMMQALLDAVLSIFDCDRAFLMYPCDPESPTWWAPMERNKPEYPGVLNLKLEIPMDSQVAETLRILLATDGPVAFGPGSEHALPENVSNQFGFKCFMSMAIHPKIGRPWQFGIHQCTHVRTWTTEEKRLFQEIGRRLGDGLTILLGYRDLRKNERFLENIVEHIPNMIFVKDSRTMSFVKFNKAGEKVLGYSREELLGKTDYDFLPKEVAAYFAAKDRQVIESKEPVDIPEEPVKNRNNEKRILHTKKIPILDDAGEPRYLLGISEDITERKKLEAQLRQTQKMEAIGQLAGGVAHDFNNMLGVIIGYSEMALQKVAGDDALREDLKQIKMAGQRSAEITRQLLAFAREQAIIPRIIDLNKIVESMLKLLQRLIGENIDLAWHPGEHLWAVKMDPSQIDQILANLCVNAKDAIAGVGIITIETQNAALDATCVVDHKEFIPGEYIKLAVSDNGSGMDKQTQDRIFEPFFTTKGLGKGTGLGLATVYGIVKQNAGFIYVYSEPEHGTTFNIYLPRHAATEADQENRQPHFSAVGHGSETILLVEDDGLFLFMVRQMLEQFGYKVLSTSTPGEAIIMAAENPGRVDLLLTDVIMPEMTGRDLENKLSVLCPEIECLFMSGYTGNIIAHRGVIQADVNFIQKPFSAQALGTKVREILDSR